MSRGRLLLLALALAACAGIGAIEARFIVAGRTDLVSATQRVAALERQLADLRQREEHTTRDLRLAENQLGRLPAVALTVATPSTVTRDPLVAGWLVRTRQLRDLAAQNPGLAIPELQLLLDEDWLRVARDAAFDTEPERRKALAALRTAAKSRFIARLSTAARAFTQSHLDEIPADIHALAAHLEPPVDPALLRRYAITPADPASGLHARWSVREISAVDEDYDSRFRVDANGSHGSGSGPAAWIDDLRPRLQRAYEAYAAAHTGNKPAGLAHVVPYINPPLAPATVEKLLQAERENPR